MSYDDEPRLRRGLRAGLNWYIATLLASLIGAAILFPFALKAPPLPPTTSPRGGQQFENDLEAARAALSRDADLNTCRSALQQINAHLGREDQRTAVPANAGQLDQLHKLFALDAEERDKGERAEIESGRFTTLDAYHLENCLLLRDAARSLELKGLGNGPDGKPLRPSPLDRAHAAFDWVVREVRLKERQGDLDPPQYVLRRGWGSSLERSLLFLELLGQLDTGNGDGLLGCLVLLPDKEKKQASFWACGVLLPGKPDVYLFDPRLGMALPGAGGKGIATLAAVQKAPAVLEQLNVKDQRYGVTAELARAAQLYVTCPLSALAPRMRLLQDELLSPAMRVKLAGDPLRDLERLKAAVREQGGKETVVQVWPEGARVLRRFLPPQEGGVDRPFPFRVSDLPGYTRNDEGLRMQMQRLPLFMLNLVPWAEMPAVFQSNYFPYNMELGRRVRDTFAGPFIVSATAPGKARDLILRGRYEQATPQLVQEHDQWALQQKRRLAAGDLVPQIKEWVDKAQHVYADKLRAPDSAEANQAVEALWKEAEVINFLLMSALAGPRDAEVTYLLGLCKHERAERMQARLDLQTRAGVRPAAADVTKARNAWKDALVWWKDYTNRHAKRAAAPAARQLRGRAQAMLGDTRAAVASLEDLSGPLTPLEKLARLYQAQQLKTK